MIEVFYLVGAWGVTTAIGNIALGVIEALAYFAFDQGDSDTFWAQHLGLLCIWTICFILITIGSGVKVWS